ncbi:MAG: type I methionyl aminopeptidase [Nocardioidaceae bacterium]
MRLLDRGIEIKRPEEVDLMRKAGIVTRETLDLLVSHVRPGITTGELDAIAERSIRSKGAVPNFKGYHGFPGTICTSVNDTVVHGIPGDRTLHDGDIISIDCGAIVDGWHGDAAITVAVGSVPDEVREMMAICDEAMWRGIAAARLGGRVTDIGHAIETYIRKRGTYGIVEDYVGHGIGTAMHQPPNVPNYGRPGRGPKLVKGLVLAVEPMITQGTIETRVLADDWTVETTDGSWSAHYENTFTLTDAGTWVLSELDGGKARLGELGIAYGGPA